MTSPSTARDVSENRPSQRRRPARVTTGPIPDSIALLDMYRIGQRLAKTATGNAWGLMLAVLGHVSGTIWLHYDRAAAVSRNELFFAGYALGVAIYTLISRSSAGVTRCLGFAEMMFAEGKVSAREYEQIRGNCLRRGDLIGR